MTQIVKLSSATRWIPFERGAQKKKNYKRFATLLSSGTLKINKINKNNGEPTQFEVFTLSINEHPQKLFCSIN